MKNRVVGYLIIIFLIATLLSCNSSPEKIKFRRYMVAGERLYELHCASCHMPDGRGFQKLYPPLAGQPFLMEEFERSICLIRYGSNDSLVINDIQYTLPMPDLQLTDLDVAEIATFIYNSWGMEKGMIDVNEVITIVKDCAARE